MSRLRPYEIDDGRTNDTSYRLFTTLTDPEVAPAEGLAVTYAERWEIESDFDDRRPISAAHEPCSDPSPLTWSSGGPGYSRRLGARETRTGVRECGTL